MWSFGGRGGKVIVVTSLADSGPGTFREACEAGGARVVVFNVAGIIRLKDRIRVRAPYITIAGSTAPGDGVCIAGNTVELETHDVVVRHMRFRRGATDVGDRNDSIGGNPIGNIMIDHVSASWGLDENMSMYRHMYRPPGGDKAPQAPDRQHHDPGLDLQRGARHLQPRLRLDDRRPQQHVPSQPLGVQHGPQPERRHGRRLRLREQRPVQLEAPHRRRRRPPQPLQHHQQLPEARPRHARRATRSATASSSPRRVAARMRRGISARPTSTATWSRATSG